MLSKFEAQTNHRCFLFKQFSQFSSFSGAPACLFEFKNIVYQAIQLRDFHKFKLQRVAQKKVQRQSTRLSELKEVELVRDLKLKVWTRKQTNGGITRTVSVKDNRLSCSFFLLMPSWRRWECEMRHQANVRRSVTRIGNQNQRTNSTRTVEI